MSDFGKILKSDFGKIPKIRWLKSDGWMDSVTLSQVIIFVDFLPFNIGILDNSHPFNVHRILSNYPLDISIGYYPNAQLFCSVCVPPVCVGGRK